MTEEWKIPLVIHSSWEKFPDIEISVILNVDFDALCTTSNISTTPDSIVSKRHAVYFDICKQIEKIISEHIETKFILDKLLLITDTNSIQLVACTSVLYKRGIKLIVDII